MVTFVTICLKMHFENGAKNIVLEVGKILNFFLRASLMVPLTMYLYRPAVTYSEPELTRAELR